MPLGTPAEKLLRATLWEFGVRFKTNEDVLGVVPSVTIPNCKVAIFVQDCDEGRCSKHSSKRSSIKYSKSLDVRDARLRKNGWTVLRVWQHEVEDTPRLVAGRMSLIVRTVRNVLIQHGAVV
jgi:DNA mismatch endonuclease (patch repair protein)